MIATGELLEMIRREAAAAAQRQHGGTMTVTSYDPDKHAVKGTLHPQDVETGWVPVGTLGVGDSFGVVVGPCIGDQLKVEFENGDPNTPIVKHRLFSDKARPVKVESGEVMIVTKFGHRILLTKDGQMIIEAKNDTQFNVTEGKLDVTIKGDTTIKTEGKLDIEAKGDTTIKSDGKLDIEAKGTLDLKSTGAMNISSTAPINITGMPTTIVS
jgi:uncharacterized protein involved in type VI secretion and phage assembly